MASSDHISNNQFWYNKWKSNLQRANPEQRMPDKPFHDWVSSDWFNPARFPTKTLMGHDPKIQNPKKVWDPNPEVARRQRVTKRPEGAPDSDYVESREAVHKFTHESMRGTGVPEHVTVYRFGKMPKDALYGSGSVDPNWPEEVRSGWRSKDVNVNKGRLHIFLVPHEDILHTQGSEGEVFFRRGTPLNKTKRSKKQQRNIESRHIDSWEGVTNYPHRNPELYKD